MRLPASLLLLLILAVPLGAQVIISPSIVLLADNERVTSVSVRNVSGTSQEVTIGFRFGYPQPDSVGSLTVRYDDTAAAQAHSMTEWLRAFPRQFVLSPGAEQVVRLIAQPPAGLADGAYWTRMVVGSQPQAPPVGAARDGTSAQVILRVEQVGSVLYRRGQPAGGVDLGSVTARFDSSGGHLLVPVTRSGVVPFLGSITVRVRDEAGTLASESRMSVSVYFDGVYRINLPAEAWRSGTRYSAEVALLAERPDMARKSSQSTAPVTARLEYTPP